MKNKDIFWNIYAIKIVCSLILLFLNPTLSKAQYKNLIMEGGGVRGIVYIGALEVLDSVKKLAAIERVGGSSAGAVQASLVAVGYTPKEQKWY